MNNKVASTFATIATFAGGLPKFGSSGKYPKSSSLEKLQMKGAPGTYNKMKHLSSAQRKKLNAKKRKKVVR